MGKNNQKILKDATTTSDLAAGGIMNTKQAAKFIRMVFDVTALLQIVRTITLPSPTYEIDKIGVGSRLMRGMAENEDMSAHTRKPVFGKLEMAAKKYALAYEISEDALEDNIEGKTLESVIAQMFATQMGLDMEDLALNGDTVYTGSAPSDTVDMVGNIDATTDPIDIVVDSVTDFPRTGEAGWIKIDSEYFKYEYIDTLTFKNCARAQNGSTIATHNDGATVTWERHELIGVDDGWLAKMYAGDANYVDLSAIGATVSEIDKAHFFELYNAIPSKYTRGGGKTKLRWLMSSLQYQKYIEYLTSRATGAGDAALFGAEYKPLGIKAIEVPSIPGDSMILCNPKNLIVGFWRKIKVRSTNTDKESIMKDLRFYNSTVRWDFEIEEEEAIAFGDGLKTVY
jgi:hypothetical protein